MSESVMTLPVEASKTTLPAETTSHPNFFNPIAELMSSIPASLEAQAVPGGAPRYIRIARLRPFLAPQAEKNEPIAGAIAEGVGYFITGMLYVQKYSLKLQDLLIQGDAGKALIETALALANTVTEKRFLDSIDVLNRDMLGGTSLNLSGAGPMDTVRTSIGTVEKYINFIPDPADLDAVGMQLYRMLVIEWGDSPAAAARKSETAPVDMTKTGKLRLLMWALNRPYAPLYNAGGANPPDVRALGMRRLWQADAAALPQKSRGTWQGAEAEQKLDPVFEASFKEPAADITELQDLLRAYGYPLETSASGVFGKETAAALAQFQKMNALEVSGELDLPTVNQLFHLRYDPDPSKGRLRKAVRFNKESLRDFSWPAK